MTAPREASVRRAVVAYLHSLAPAVCSPWYNRGATPFADLSCSFARRGLPRWIREGGFTMPKRAEFWCYVEVTPTCWTWTGAHTEDGYGVTRFLGEGKMIRATLASWKIHFGTAPAAGIFILHTCDNPPCIRPDHLFLGTAADNARDCKVKGRNRTGERHGRAKLTWPLVAEIRSSTEAAYSIARRLGVHKSTVLDARKGVTWQR